MPQGIPKAAKLSRNQPRMIHMKAFVLVTLYISSATLGLAWAATTNATDRNTTQHIASRPTSRITKLLSTKIPSVMKDATTTTTATIATPATSIKTHDQIPSVTNNKTSKQTDHRAEASLLRPSFIRGLLGSHKRPGGGGGKLKESDNEDDMEEVTQTIMVPIKESDRGQMSGRSKSASSGIRSQETSVPSDKSRHANNKLGNRAHQLTHPLAEASLQLTSTEIGGLLNDREAPEFYREREQSGDGILVGEEPAPRLGASSMSSNSRLGMAASGPFGSQFPMGDYGPSGGVGGGFDGGENAAALYRHRLAQAASEDGYSGGGFNHRFGQQQSSYGGGFGTDMRLNMAGSGSQFGGGGGLMQSPNEFNEVNNYNSGFGNGGFMGGSSSQGQYFGSGGGDYSPNSGLLRAGSESSFGGGGSGGSFGQGMMGEFGGNGGGGMGEFGAGPAGFYGSGSGRLQAHASYNPYLAGEADYANRLGYNGMGGASSFGADQRGFASQNNHQIVPQRLNQAASGGGRNQANNRLMPLTPVIPLAEELGAGGGGMQPNSLSSNNHDQVAQGPGQLLRSQQQHHHQMMTGSQVSGPGRGSQQQQQQVHEALEDDPTDVSQADDSQGGGTGGGNEQNYDNSFDGSTSSPFGASGAIGDTGPNSGGGGNDMSGMVTSTMSSNQRDQFAGPSGKPPGYGPSFVLNVPPPNESSGYNMQRPHQRSMSQQQQQQMVEFSRIGSAGYLGPGIAHDSSASQHHGHSMLAKKFGEQHQIATGYNDQLDQSAEDNDEPSDDSSSSGADNPAHAGKYIIDK